MRRSSSTTTDVSSGPPLAPDRPVAAVTQAVLAAVRELGGEVEIDPTPQETSWSTPLDEDTEHADYDRDQVTTFFAAATQAALVLAALRAPFRGRSTPVNAWWGSFDLAVSLFSGEPAKPPSDDFIMRNAMDSQEVAIGWWPGDAALSEGGVLRLRPPRAARLRAQLRSHPPRPRWEPTLGEYILDWDDVVASADPHRTGARVRLLSGQARLHGVQLGSGADGERGGSRRHRSSEQSRL